MKIAAIILMAGAGERFGHSLPKQFHRLSGKPLYQHTLDAFSNLFDDIVLVVHPDFVDKIEVKGVRVIPGGATRQASSFLGIQACPDADIVVIHDGARPFVDERILEDVIESAKAYGAVNTCIPSKDTLVTSQDGQKIDSIPDRSHFLRGQTPQAFSKQLIIDAHKKALSDGITNATDDCQLVHRLGHTIHVVQGSEKNIKITSQLDLFLAEQLMRERQILPEGTGQLKNKRFLVCGGTGGIGEAICKHLDDEGATAISISRSSKEFATDCRSFKALQSTFQKIQQRFGPLDGLINCVGLLKIKSVKDLTEDEMRDIIDSNLMSTIYSCSHAPLKSNSSIVNVASSSYSRGRAGYALYSAAKAAVVNFSQGLAEELSDMRINTLVPTRVNTPMRTQNFPDANKEELLDPADVAKSVIQLLKNQELTGAVVGVKP